MRRPGAARRALAAATVLVWAAAGPFAAEPRPGPSIRESIVGTWGRASEGGCTEKPHTIAFSADGGELYLRYTDPPGQGTYRVVAEGPSHLRLALRNEVQKTEDGEPVEWDLVLLAPDTYSWHRADWSETLRTWPVRRCAAADLIGLNSDSGTGKPGGHS